MENLDKETLEIHEKMRKHFTPLNGHILIEFVENLKTSGGLYLPPSSEETKSIAHPIVQLPANNVAGSSIETLKVGDWISLRSMQVDIFKMYGRKFAIIRDFDVMLKVDMNYVKDELSYKEAARTGRALVN
jgi:co-chaperonin GroES (HSP10)